MPRMLAIADCGGPMSTARTSTQPNHEPIERFDARIKTPFATLGIRTSDRYIEEIIFLSADVPAKVPMSNTLAHLACVQLMAYLDKPAFKFDLPYKLTGTHHQIAVWQAMCRIPAGEIRTYSEIAAEIDSAARAVGTACGRNLLPIVVPCHRIVAANGLGGFMGGKRDDPLAIKRWLLHHEGAL